jgi:hypothetical protein
MTLTLSPAFAIVVYYYDGSGVLGVYGPFLTEERAEAVSVELQTFPDVGSAGKWTVVAMGLVDAPLVVDAPVASGFTEAGKDHYQARVREMRELRANLTGSRECGSLLGQDTFPGSRCHRPSGHTGAHGAQHGYPHCQLCLMSYEMDHHHDTKAKGYHTFVGPLPL